MLIELLFGFVRAGERRSVRTDRYEIHAFLRGFLVRSPTHFSKSTIFMPLLASVPGGYLGQVPGGLPLIYDGGSES